MASASTRLLVAYDEGFRQKVCGRMCGLPTDEDNHPMKSASATTNYTGRASATFCNNVSRLCGKIARVQRKRYHPHHHRSRVHQGGHLGALSRGYGSRGHCRIIQRMRFSLHWDPHMTYFRPRHEIHLLMVQGAVSGTRGHTKSKYGLSPTD